MNQDAGATIQDIQRGICETGTKGGVEVSRETQEQACIQAGIDPPADYSTVIIVGAIALILFAVVAAYFLVNRTRKKPIKKSHKKA